MKIINIPSLTNNYIWILYNNRKCIIVDPGDHKPVFKILKKLNLTPIAIFLTHYHNDHTEGIPKLLTYYKIPIYGPKKKLKTNTYITTIISDGDIINILNLKFKIISLPGHTPEHIGFYSNPWLFCGDTIFSGGCGKIYKNSEKKMYQSIQKIKKLNENTLICSAHEYTLSNIQFSMSIIPNDINLILYKNYIKKIQINKKSIKPSKLKDELKINLFLRCNEIKVKHALGLPMQEEEWKVFSILRKKKDKYSSNQNKIKK